MPEPDVTDGRSNGAAIARLIRLPNLILLTAIQILVFLTGHPESWDYFLLIACMTICATAAGYVINDIMDVDTDRINGRNNVTVTGHVTRLTAKRIYFFSILTGAIACVILSVTWSPHFLWMYGCGTLLLWLYSPYLKAMPLAGNLAVSIFCGAAVLVVWYPAVQFDLVPQNIVLLTGFAFMVTLIREIVKDMEDIRGDLAVRYRTLPIALGISFSKAVVIILLLVTTGALIILTMRQSPGTVSLISYGLTIGLLIVAGLRLSRRGNDKASYHRISTVLKVAMLFGTASLLF